MTIFTRIGPIAPATYERHGLNATQAMNLLQERHIISDNCERMDEIAEADRWKVVSFFEDYGNNPASGSNKNTLGV